MRIVYVSGSQIPSLAANSIHVMKMCQAFAQLGHEVTLLARWAKETCDDLYSYYGVAKQFPIVRLHWPEHKAGGIIYGLQVGRWLRRQRPPDVIYGRCVYGLLAACRQPASLGYEAHRPPPSKIHAQMETALLRREEVKVLVVISEALKREYLRRFPWLGDRPVVVAPDGADPISNDTEAVSLSPCRDDCLQVGYVGHLYPGKGMELISMLAQRMRDADFHVIGGSPRDIAQWKARCTSHNIHFHGYIPHREIPHYILGLDVLLAPYQRRVAVFGGGGDVGRWMSPLKIFEYMAAGKPIVASDLPVLREVLRDEENALLCDPADAAAWEAAVRRLECDAMLRESLAQRAREGFLRDHTWEQRARTVLARLEVKQHDRAQSSR